MVHKHKRGGTDCAYQYTLHGWPSHSKDVPVELAHYFQRQYELSIHLGCLMCGSRVIVPDNGLAERVVQTLNRALKYAKADGGAVKQKLAQFLLAYINAPHSLTNETPAMLFMGWPLRKCLDLSTVRYFSR